MSEDDSETALLHSNSSATPPPEAPPTIPYFIPRRPRVVRMRDLSPATRDQLTREYFDAYDPWTGIRIAATLGLFISLFALFLAYKSRFHHRNSAKAAARNAANKTSLYLYDDEDISLSSGSSGMELPGFHLEEVYVKSSSSVVAALKVKRSSRSGKIGTMRIVEDASRSLPCSPLKTDAKSAVGACRPAEEEPDCRRHEGRGRDEEGRCKKNRRSHGFEVEPVIERKHGRRSHKGEWLEEEVPAIERKHGRRSLGAVEDSDWSKRHGQDECPPIVDKRRSPESTSIASMEEEEEPHSRRKGGGRRSLDSPSVVVVVAKKPQDYRSRSTVVSIARRQRLAS